LKLDLNSKRLAIFGMPGGGKSNLCAYVLDQYGSKAFIYDPMHEYPLNQAYSVYRPKDRYSIVELTDVLTAAIKRRKYKLVAIDETNRYAPSKPHPLPEILAEINDCCRHEEYGCFTPVWIARRPTQLNQDLTELAHYLIIFNLKGKNDIDMLNDFSRGLGDAVFKLPQYHFVVVDQNRTWKEHKPVRYMALDKVERAPVATN